MIKSNLYRALVMVLVSIALAGPAHARDVSGAKALDLKKSSSALPQSQVFTEPAKTPHSLDTIKPPKSGDFYQGDTKEAEYEHVLDEEINTLYKLSRTNRHSPNRGEIWLRLGEQYVEKARLISWREQAQFEKNQKDYQAKKTRIRPQLNSKASHEYNIKAVELYQWFVKDFPSDPKIDQALFFLGYNQFELGNTQLGEKYYSQLVHDFPDSVYVAESHFALAEYYFENEAWKMALENYAKVLKARRTRLNSFALYKSAWCLYRLGRTPVALKALEKVIHQSRVAESEASETGVHKPVNRLRLGQEAMRDYVPFYAQSDVSDPAQAPAEFARVTGNEKQTQTMLERLAYIYADSGNRVGSRAVFKYLIGQNPLGERAAEYQYQIVVSNITHDQKEFRSELGIWLDSFGPLSSWAKENAKNTKLIADVGRLQETTLRNYVLQQHQTAQNSRAPFSQNAALVAYAQYVKYFSNSPKIAEMQFFHAELFFDMNRFDDAAATYSWVADKDPKGPYHEKAIVDALLALEKVLPATQEIDAKRGKSLEPLPLDPPVQRFEKAALRYIETFPHGEKTNDIKRRLGVIYYGYNHFDEAIGMFEQVIKDKPKSENAEIAGNLILDIYKIRGDMQGLAKRGRDFLSNPQIAGTRFGQQVRVIMEKAGYLEAEKTASSGDAAKAAKGFEEFAIANPNSELGHAARYNAAINYEKAGDVLSAIRMYNVVLASAGASSVSNPKLKSAQNDSKNALARIYQQTGQLEQAAIQYRSYAESNPKDQKAINAFFNAGVLFDSLGETAAAMKCYQSYMDQSTKRDRNEVLFEMAEMHYREGQPTTASAGYEKYLQSGPHHRDRVVKSSYMIAKIAERKGQESVAKRWFQVTINEYEASPGAAREQTVKYAVEARFFLDQDTLNKLYQTTFGTSDKQQARAAGDMNYLSQRYINQMKDVIRYDNGTYIVAALASTGKMFDRLAYMFSKIPTPKGLNAAETEQYRGLIQQKVDGYHKDAQKSYQAAVDKSHELEIYTPWTKVAQSGLQALQPDAGGINDTGEIVIESRAVDWMGL